MSNPDPAQYLRRSMAARSAYRAMLSIGRTIGDETPSGVRLLVHDDVAGNLGTVDTGLLHGPADALPACVCAGTGDHDGQSVECCDECRPNLF
jgi:hypothetical protein